MIWPFRKKPVEQKDTIKLSDHEPWRSWFGKVAGVAVNVDTSLTVTTVLSATRVIAEDVAKLPCNLKETKANGSIEAVPLKDTLATLVHSRPNDWMTAFAWRETMTMHAALTGNAFSLIARNGRGVPIELVPVMPEWVEIEIGDNNEPVYNVRDKNGTAITGLTRDKIFHLSGPSWNGMSGMSAIVQARNAIGLAIATEKTQMQLHTNAGRPSGILTTEQALSQEVKDNLKKSWNAEHQSVENAMKTAILGSGIKFQPLTMTSVDAQHIETRKMQIEEICRGIKIFPQMVGHADKTATYASAEAFFRAHFEHTIWPWLIRWQQTLDRDLLDRDGPLFVEFDVSKFGRSSLKDRAQYYVAMTQSGIMTRNEARIEEGLPPLPGLDEPLTPLNMRQGDDGKPNDQTDDDTTESQTDE
jgi:HK97 family phage portal protein